MNAPPARLTADRLACERGGRNIFDNVSFDVRAGGFLELRGPNGSGKSSLLRLLAGFIKPSAGAVSIVGRVNYVGHLDAIKLALTVRENLTFWSDYLGSGDIAVALRAFALTPLADDPASYLSQGQKRRLALSRLVLTESPVWLLDEPTVGLDAASLEALRVLLVQHLAAGGIIVAATHAGLGLEPAHLLTLEARA